MRAARPTRGPEAPCAAQPFQASVTKYLLRKMPVRCCANFSAAATSKRRRRAAFDGPDELMPAGLSAPQQLAAVAVLLLLLQRTAQTRDMRYRAADIGAVSMVAPRQLMLIRDKLVAAPPAAHLRVRARRAHALMQHYFGDILS